MAEVEPNNSHQKKTTKNKKKHLPKYAQFLLTGIAGAAIGAGLTFGIMEVKELKSPFYQVEKVYEQLQGSYYKKVSSQTLRQGAINGMLDSLNDPFSEGLSGAKQEQVNNILEGSTFGGVGIQMAVRNNKVVVDSIVANSPASKSTIKPGDEIVAVDNKKVSAAQFTKVASLVRGKVGTKVTLKLKRANSTFNVTLKRAKISQSSLTKRTEGNATIITITQFDVNTAKDLKSALKSINTQKYPRLIIDLQDNPGGEMNAALKSASYFLPNKKIIMQYKDRKEKEVIRSDKKLSGDFHTSLKPIILINGNTASASEIFTAALVQNHCGVSVGQTSYGKGTVQQVGQTEDSEYKYTVAKWLTPNGTWINQKGLKPTYPVSESPLAKLPQFQSMSVLKKSMTGVDVVTLQQYLTALGYLPKHVTGVFDDETKNAVIKFQKEHDLTTDGIVNGQVQAQLYLAVAQKLQDNNPALKKALSLNLKDMED
ncbi:S41 family peptidase [Lactobacillus gasseri]|jgi:carboxyl-terminal processing protease|uniref:S41 family peptidase n=1 Tax=Lactobacillus TaxID=1578 RepID=UPI0007EF8F23|nr:MULTISPECIES: S41 family peptidase [Lactobacillus]MBO3730957.1 S41 family peptidase [Lactobacillus paragasseri]MCZ3495071.1 S41 family peptidase [Lactobacillus gasseri]MCZ3537738.1 S41 family peptidase [Lactobacillus gasseri]MCZ3540330.1 S41 family peptidase [Lactobacillus gasseri]MCZ3546966.1 S41 family peptidase [Lactobacillus gasseri]